MKNEQLYYFWLGKEAESYHWRDHYYKVMEEVESSD